VQPEEQDDRRAAPAAVIPPGAFDDLSLLLLVVDGTGIGTLANPMLASCVACPRTLDLTVHGNNIFVAGTLLGAPDAPRKTQAKDCQLVRPPRVRVGARRHPLHPVRAGN
jgi:hypothetical protein